MTSAVATDSRTDATEDRQSASPIAPRLLPFVAVMSPVWPTWFGVLQLQVGRVLLAVLVVAILFDIATRRIGRLRPWWAAAGASATMTLLAAWNAVSVYTWGCACTGSAQGTFSTAALFAVVALVLLYATPRQAVVALVASVAGVLVGGLIALAGFQDLHAEVFAPASSESRLQGVYGNPNSLGYALALALPIVVAGVARLRGRRRVVACVVAMVLAGLLLATFSRASLLAAGIGSAATLLVAVPALRNKWVVIGTGIAVPVLLVALIASPFYRGHRTKADFGEKASDEAKSTPSLYWTNNPNGPIDEYGSVLENPEGTNALRVTIDKPYQGVTHRLGNEFTAGRWTWQMRLSLPDDAPPARIRWQVQRGNGAVLTRGSTRLDRTNAIHDARLNVRTRTDDYLLLQLWSAAPTVFQMDELITQGNGPDPDEERDVSMSLLNGTAATLSAAESRYVESRTTGVELALKAFASSPIIGIGANEFPDYADRRADFGQLATHNTYAQVASELGVIGFLLLMGTGAFLVLALLRSTLEVPLLAAIIGVCVANAVNWVFLNGLTAPGNLMPFAIAAGMATGFTGVAPDRLRRKRPAPVSADA